MFKTCWDVLVLFATIYVAIMVPYNASFPDSNSLMPTELDSSQFFGIVWEKSDHNKCPFREATSQRQQKQHFLILVFRDLRFEKRNNFKKILTL